MRVHLCWVCSKAHPDMRSHSHNLALHLIQLWQRWKQPEQTWLCLPPWFCAIILFPLLVVIYWAFIKTEWARSQPGSINRPPPPRQTKVNSLSCVPFFLPSPSLRPSYLLLLFLLSFFSLPPPLSPPFWYPLLLLSGENRGVLSQFNLQLRVGGAGAPANVTLSFIPCRGILEDGRVFVSRVVGWLSRGESPQAQENRNGGEKKNEKTKGEWEWIFTTSTIQTW